MSNTALYETAAASLVKLLPTDSTLTPSVTDVSAVDAGQVKEAIVTNFVGTPSADLAIALADSNTFVMDPEATNVSIADVLQPALEAATGAIGSGALGETRVSDATALFNDADAAIFALSDGEKTVAWFAIRIRENATAAAATLDDAEVAKNLGRINNVEMSLTVEIGRTRMPVREVLALEPGAVVELDRSAGSPADILLNGRLIALGEIVVVDQDYAVRVTRILDTNAGNSN